MSLEVEIKKFYDEIKFPGVYTKEQLDYYPHCPNNRYLKFIYSYLKDGQEVLDAGCGTGMISNVFATRFNSNFTSVDFADSIKVGKEYACKNNINNVNWIQESLVTFKSNKEYDVIICQGVLHHIPEYKEVLEKLKGMLAPNGVLLLGLYNPFGKILKKFVSINYKSDVLYLDQEKNPFELSFTISQTLNMCSDLEFLGAAPGFKHKYLSNISSILSSASGGLILYAFRRK